MTRAGWLYLEFFTANIRNPNTRRAYARACSRFFGWCERRGLQLAGIRPVDVAAYIEELQCEVMAPSVKQQLAAIRMLCDWLVVGQVMPSNPASSVRGPKHVVKSGKTLVLEGTEWRRLMDAIPQEDVPDLRDRALVAVLTYSFARIGAALQMRVEDMRPQGAGWMVRLHEKGAKQHAMPAHHGLAEAVHAYMGAAGIGEDRKGWLFRSGKGRRPGPVVGAGAAAGGCVGVDSPARSGSWDCDARLVSLLPGDADHRLLDERRHA